ncbi:MAG TPA: MazG-like family protein [Ramlibacter sp.]|nr:MazG-like family protein [Ramlibacter sp.]
MSDLRALAADVIAFRDERDWKQFHNTKDVALSLLLESSELLEIFQWTPPEKVGDRARDQRERISEELADVLYYTLLLAHDQGIDLAAALRAKLQANAAKYPVEKARGRSDKYTEL